MSKADDVEMQASLPQPDGQQPVQQAMPPVMAPGQQQYMQPMPGQMMPGQPMPGQMMPGQPMPGYPGLPPQGYQQQNIYPNAVPDPSMAASIEHGQAEQKAATEANPLNQVPGLAGRTDRQKFMIKVWSIVGAQLLLTAFMSWVAMTDENVRKYMENSPLIMIGCVITMIVLLIGIFCCKTCSRKVPANYVILTLFTASFGYLVAFITTAYPPQIVFSAALITGCMVVGLTLMALFMNDNQMGCCYIFGFALAATLLPMIILSFFFMTYFMYIAITAGLVLLFSFYIVYDTRMIMDRFGFDDYIIAAVILYVDIINLFLKILALMGSRN